MSWTFNGTMEFPADSSELHMYVGYMDELRKKHGIPSEGIAVLNYVIKPNTPEDARKWMDHGNKRIAELEAQLAIEKSELAIEMGIRMSIEENGNETTKLHQVIADLTDKVHDLEKPAGSREGGRE
jgi:uncharacterized coiled-coil protein SlyX